MSFFLLVPWYAYVFHRSWSSFSGKKNGQQWGASKQVRGNFTAWMVGKCLQLKGKCMEIPWFMYLYSGGNWRQLVVIPKHHPCNWMHFSNWHIWMECCLIIRFAGPPDPWKPWVHSRGGHVHWQRISTKQNLRNPPPNPPGGSMKQWDELLDHGKKYPGGHWWLNGVA